VRDFLDCLLRHFSEKQKELFKKGKIESLFPLVPMLQRGNGGCDALRHGTLSIPE